MTTMYAPQRHLTSAKAPRAEWAARPGDARMMLRDVDGHRDVTMAFTGVRSVERDRAIDASVGVTDEQGFAPSWRSRDHLAVAYSNTEGRGSAFSPQRDFQGRGVRAGGEGVRIFEHSQRGGLRSVIHRIRRVAQSPGGLLVMLAFIGTVFGIASQDTGSFAEAGSSSVVQMDKLDNTAQTGEYAGQVSSAQRVQFEKIGGVR